MLILAEVFCPLFEYETFKSPGVAVVEEAIARLTEVRALLLTVNFFNSAIRAALSAKPVVAFPVQELASISRT